MDRRKFLQVIGVGVATGFEYAEGQSSNVRQKYKELEKSWAGSEGKVLKDLIEAKKKSAVENRKESDMQKVAEIQEKQAEIYQLMYDLLKQAEQEMDNFEKIRAKTSDHQNVQQQMLANSVDMMNKFRKAITDIRILKLQAPSAQLTRTEVRMLEGFLPELEKFINELREANKSLDIQLTPINLSDRELIK
jgi:vacuolar-type H+-ATPase catalytic subunit A/Vma1